MLVALAVFSTISYSVQVKGITQACEKMIVRTRALAFENTLKQPVGWFDLETSSPGIIANRLARNGPIIKSVTIISRRNETSNWSFLEKVSVYLIFVGGGSKSCTSTRICGNNNMRLWNLSVLWLEISVNSWCFCTTYHICIIQATSSTSSKPS